MLKRLLHLDSLGLPDYGTIKNIRNFNSKCENGSLLVFPLPGSVPDGLATCRYSVIAHTYIHNVNK